MDNVTGAWTEYGYDKVGNRTYEAYSRLVSGNRVYEQNARISYDELNRVTRIDDLRADIRYEYDAQSNRRWVWSVYQDGVYGYESTQEYWYTYDSMNRFLVTRGKLSAARPSTETGTATIVATGVDGVQVAYDKAGQRTQAIYGLDGHREHYTSTADGLVENTSINNVSTAQGALRASRANDLMGRVAGYTAYDTN